jgi:biotin carboxyl carrier protein
MKSSSPISGILTAACAVSFLFAARVSGEAPILPTADALLRFESGAAARVIEKVRANRPGTVIEVFAKVGDTVKKGQVLGHTELDAVKMSKDMAQATMEAQGNVDEKFWQQKAWTIQREEAEEAVKRRQVPKSRLEWATSMEKMYEAMYRAQLEAEDLQKIQYEFYTQEYDARFFRAPVEGVVSEFLVAPGQGVNFATHVATVKNDAQLSVPVTLPVSLADSAMRAGTLLVRSPNGRAMIRAVVDSMVDDPAAPGERKIAKLLINEADLPSIPGQKTEGVKFDVFVPNDPTP